MVLGTLGKGSFSDVSSYTSALRFTVVDLAAAEAAGSSAAIRLWRSESPLFDVLLNPNVCTVPTPYGVSPN
jgi:hypothetical protein